MALATYEDANKHLDETKLSFLSDEDAAPEAEKAETIVRAYLADTFPDYAGLWVYPLPDPNPDELLETPELVREAASMLMASYRYAKVYSEESMDGNPYALKLEKDAYALLQGIVDGSLVLADVDYGDDASTSFSQDDFWPNNKTTVMNELLEEEFATYNPELASTRMHRMGQRF